MVGNSETKRTYRGALKWAMWARRKARTLLLREVGSGLEADPGAEFLAHVGVGYAEDLGVGDGGVLV